MYKYTCDILVAKGLCSPFTLLEEIVIESPTMMNDRDLKLQVINHVPEKYDNFGPMTYKMETIDDYCSD